MSWLFDRFGGQPFSPASTRRGPARQGWNRSGFFQAGPV